MALAACGDDSDSGDEDEQSGPTTTTEPAPTTTTTQPSALDDEEAVFAIVEDVYDEQADLADQMYQNPELVNDEEHIEQLRALVTGQVGDGVDGLVEEVRALRDDGVHLEATGEVMSDRAIDQLEVVDADTVSFGECHLGDNTRVDEDGNQVGEPTVFGVFGVGEAKRVDGTWRIASLEAIPEMRLEAPALSPGYLEPGACSAGAEGFNEGASQP
jgi:hypothetical protein